MLSFMKQHADPSGNPLWGLGGPHDANMNKLGSIIQLRGMAINRFLSIAHNGLLCLVFKHLVLGEESNQ